MPTMELVMNIRHQNIIDSYFEEYHYQSAIDALDQFRCPSFAPSPAHIRQTVFMALNSSIEPATQFGKHAIAFPQSPSKFSPSKAARQLRDPAVVSPEAVVAAERLLLSFVETNTPAALLRGLPSYDTAPPEIPEEGDCVIATLSNRLLQAKCVWELLSSSFMKRNAASILPTTPRRRSRNKRRDPVDHFAHTLEDDDTQDCPISDNAWMVLEFFICIFEADERSVKEQPNTSPHSLLLLSQIPTARDNQAARTDLNQILTIVFHCWKDGCPRRRSLGSRLIAMLIHLTSTPHLDGPMLLSSAFSHIAPLPAEQTATILAEIPWSPDVARFKLLLCVRFINSHTSKPAAQARPQARSARAVGRAKSQQSVVAPPEPEQAVRAPSTIPLSVSEVSQLLDCGISHLRLLAASQQGDTEWADFLSKNTWQRSFIMQKGQDLGGRSYLQALEAALS
ncbi:hypothetical protein BDV98DRAFT_599786 [Pterulicium gracile]|uniref:Uncharacterized protein n=1 Tax=Pterulicium gracile TaxID=1884261 RepID=A0A5C3R2T7_9AGAR|nr:hypothetical protein BDV98DRAFT_599786 [Pterula gracilis]